MTSDLTNSHHQVGVDRYVASHDYLHHLLPSVDHSDGVDCYGRTAGVDHLTRWLSVRVSSLYYFQHMHKVILFHDLGAFSVFFLWLTARPRSRICITISNMYKLDICHCQLSSPKPSVWTTPEISHFLLLRCGCDYIAKKNAVAVAINEPQKPMMRYAVRLRYFVKKKTANAPIS